MEENALEKTTRINQLFDYYASLLTKKQQTFLACYFHDDYSLGEIAAEFGISRQAVYEHIKRAEAMLDEYEQKLQLHRKHEQRVLILQETEKLHHSQGGLTLTELQQRFIDLLLID